MNSWSYDTAMCSTGWPACSPITPRSLLGCTEMTRMMPSSLHVHTVSSSTFTRLSTLWGCPTKRSLMSPQLPQEKMAREPLCVPHTTLRPDLMMARERNSSSIWSDMAKSLPLRLFHTDRYPSPPAQRRVLLSSARTMSEMKSSCSLSSCTHRCWRRSQSLTTPSSSPLASMVSSITSSEQIAASCACARMPEGRPAVTSKAPMHASVAPLKRVLPSAENCSARHDCVWWLMSARFLFPFTSYWNNPT
mmetsp:Transcript_60285/g.142024  ORF Transcript_60285/g.142024 Transcript_60285/m.142024 type:complete len:248 (+) Transcript_60285:271-1014(+)